MRFRVTAARNKFYEDHTGRNVPDSVEVDSLEDLIAWIKQSGSDAIISPPNQYSKEPEIMVYNDYVE